ncbi:cannabinoid receptor 2 [Thalassophryne amazonica]|uniref:cannabinoid receptor 2 n=1 Tax=Thalassophryne amazonica TaxID=390379 RepID=UPI0014721B78|nr:cannabinoid receptor 2 [Thalassophryne amazonica]
MEELKASLGPLHTEDNILTAANSSCEALECFMVLIKEEKIAVGAICLLVGPFTLLGNALVLGLIATTATLRRRPSYVFIGSLALADIFVSSFFTTNFLAFHLFSHHYGATVFLFMLGGVIMAFTGSVGSLLLTALDRYLCIHQAWRYKALLTCRRAFLSLLILWGSIIFISFLPLMGWSCPTGLSPPCSRLFPYISHGYLAFWICFILIILMLILGAYALILWKAHHHESSMTNLHARQDHIRMDIRLARTFGLILLFLIGCWLPALSFMLADIFVYLTHTQQRIFAICSTLCLLNSAVNPLLYAMRCQELRAALLQLIKNLHHKKYCHKCTTNSNPNLSSEENCNTFPDSDMPITTNKLNSVSQIVDKSQVNNKT